jgi:phosphotransferase system HPr (HPr) family protein
VRSERLVIQNPSGLHARPAATFVRVAGRYRSSITIRNVTADRPAVDAKSILGVLTLGVERGTEIEITAEGEDAEAALGGLREAVEAGLGETLEPSA